VSVSPVDFDAASRAGSKVLVPPPLVNRELRVTAGADLGRPSGHSHATQRGWLKYDSAEY
jgi:hypothetical protein